MSVDPTAMGNIGLVVGLSYGPALAAPGYTGHKGVTEGLDPRPWRRTTGRPGGELPAQALGVQRRAAGQPALLANATMRPGSVRCVHPDSRSPSAALSIFKQTEPAARYFAPGQRDDIVVSFRST
jgi:hypothetical protein